LEIIKLKVFWQQVTLILVEILPLMIAFSLFGICIYLIIVDELVAAWFVIGIVSTEAIVIK